MKFIEYSCYYLYTIFINRGKYHYNAKIATVAYVAISIFFYLISPFLFLRFLKFNIEEKYEYLIKGSFIFVALFFYIVLYYKIEKENKFAKIIKKYDNINPSPYSKFAVWSFILGGLVCFCLVFVVIAMISRR
jgi:hypothetical protein